MSFKKGDKGRFDTDRRERGNVTTEAETGVVQPQVEEFWQPPETGRGKDWILPSSPREHDLADTLISELWSLELRANKFLLFSATTLWHFFTATQGNKYIGPIEGGHLPKRPSKLPYQSEKQ